MKCPNCEKEFMNKKSLSNHFRWHNGSMNKNSYKGINIGDKNGMWKGDNVKIGSLHDYIKIHKYKPELCEMCRNKKSYDLANISGKYKRDVNDFMWLCRSCHMKLDYKSEIRKSRGK